MNLFAGQVEMPSVGNGHVDTGGGDGEGGRIESVKPTHAHHRV